MIVTLFCCVLYAAEYIYLLPRSILYSYCIALLMMTMTATMMVLFSSVQCSLEVLKRKHKMYLCNQKCNKALVQYILSMSRGNAT